jgi:hypothetical protein
MKIPQADNVSNLLDIPLAISQGISSYTEVSKRYQFVIREAQYYLAAVELLGLIVRDGKGFALSPIGNKFVALPYQERKVILTKQILNLPIVREVVVELITTREHLLTLGDLRECLFLKSSVRQNRRETGSHYHELVYLVIR